MYKSVYDESIPLRTSRGGVRAVGVDPVLDIRDSRNGNDDGRSTIGGTEFRNGFVEVELAAVNEFRSSSQFSNPALI